MIRRAEPGDLDRLIELHRGFCDIDDHPFDAQRARAAFLPLLSDDSRGVVWIMDPAEGYAVLTWGWSIEAGGLEAVLDEIFVTRRGEGRGTALLEHVVADGEQRGLSRIFLETESHNRRGRALYERCGFVAEESVWMTRTFIDLS
jgi:GNAT superfamily N-acetyltransferase